MVRDEDAEPSPLGWDSRPLAVWHEGGSRWTSLERGKEGGSQTRLSAQDSAPSSKAVVLGPTRFPGFPLATLLVGHTGMDEVSW